MPPTPTPAFDIQLEVAKLKTLYSENALSKKLNVLLLGDSGSGKTFLARTCPGPVHIDAFDPGATKGLRKEIESGHVIVDNRWENENPWNPTVFKEWEKETERRIKGGYFDFVKTYMLDSATTWSAAIMNEILKRAGIPGQNPRFTHDYGPQKIAIMNWVKRLLSLPCHFILTGHLEIKRDEVVGKVEKRFMTTGNAYVTIPLQFDELWIAQSKQTSKGIVYQLLTQSTGSDIARSRLSQDGLLETYEEPNFNNILKKTGYAQQ